MILSKDLQEILEGVHYFLSEALPGEPLSGKLECLRRGLVLQLEALALSYPTLRIRTRSSASLPYLAMDQANLHIVQHRSESMSSGSSGSNSYSNSSSGDGLVMGQGRGGYDTLNRQHIFQDEDYEDFQDNKCMVSQRDSAVIEETLERSREDEEEKDDAEDVYMETVEAVAFSSIIATCDRHGILMKKTKGLLRNVKNYHCVAASGMLYLYNKETDERQRKTIDLTGYSARAATGEDIRDQRKKDAAFEIVGPGKKTHTFIARTAHDKMDWLAAIDRSIKYGRIRSQTSSNSLAEGVGNNNNNRGDTDKQNNEIILPPKAPPPQQSVHRTDTKPIDEYYYYHDVVSDATDEVYEEVDPESLVVGSSETLPPPPPQLLLNPQSSQLPDYDPVYPDDFPHPPSLATLPSTPSLGRRPPGRPPLPNFLQDHLNKQVVRPLPDAPSESSEGADDPIGIYCEIEEDVLEAGRENFLKALDSERENNKMEAINFGNSDKESVFSDDIPHQKTSEMPSLPARSSSNSLVGFLSDEIFMNISEFSPSHNLNKYPQRSSNPVMPPKLPPKGIPLPSVADDDSEYKVPIVSNIDAEYQIPPPNPVPTDAEETAKVETVHEISGPIPTSSQMYQVPPSQTIVSIKPNKNERKNSIIEEHSKPLSSFLSGQEDPYPRNTLKVLTNRFEKIDNIQESDGAKNVQQLGQGTSVKDMIARINKNKSLSEKADQSKSREELVVPDVTVDEKVDGATLKFEPSPENTSSMRVSEQKLIKPVLPPRPHNLLNGATITQKNMPPIEEIQNTDSKIENDDAFDDDHYETPDDNSFDSSSQQDSEDTDQGKDTVAPWRLKPEKIGDWYVAKFAFIATIDQALSFNRGDVMQIHDTTGSSGWWKATLKGRSGLVPREYLKKKD